MSTRAWWRPNSGSAGQQVPSAGERRVGYRSTLTFSFKDSVNPYFKSSQMHIHYKAEFQLWWEKSLGDSGYSSVMQVIKIQYACCGNNRSWTPGSFQQGHFQLGVFCSCRILCSVQEEILLSPALPCSQSLLLSWQMNTNSSLLNLLKVSSFAEVEGKNRQFHKRITEGF